MADTRTIEIEVLRYNPEKDAEPHLQSFQVPFTHDTSVLQGLQYIKDHLDGSLTFRWSCRMAICGSCGKMVNGKPELSCHTFLRDYYPGKVRIEPLNHFPILRDLVIDQTDFRENIKIDILNVSKDALLEDFENSPEIPKSGLYQHIYTEEFGQAGGEPIGAMIANYEFGPGPCDIALMQRCSAVAAMSHCPFVASQ